MARKPFWVPFSHDQNVASATDSKVNLLADMVLDREAAGGLTVTRIIGCVQFMATTVAGSQNAFNLGVRVAHESQAASSPNIATDSSNQWLYTLLRRLSGRVTETAAGTFATWFETLYFDIKVQRKILSNFEVASIVQNGSGDALSTHWGGRVLLKLP